MIIYLYGPDTYRSRQKLKVLVDKFKREIDPSGINIEYIDGATATTQEVERAIKTPPFLAPKRMVVIERILENKDTAVGEAALDGVSQVPVDKVITLFWEGAVKQTKRKPAKATKKPSKVKPKLGAILEKEKFAQHFELLTPSQVKEFANTLFKERAGTIERDALTVLVDTIGNDLWRLSNEINKLIAHANNKSIAVADVEKLVTSKLEQDVFALTDAISERRTADALRLISEQFSAGVAPLELLSTITWQIRTMIMVQDFISQNGAGYSPERVAAGLSIHPFVAKKIMRVVDRHSADTLKKTYHGLRNIDRKIKTSQENPQALLDLLVAKM